MGDRDRQTTPNVEKRQMHWFKCHRLC